MTQYIDFLNDALWSEADIMARGRALIEAQTPLARQQELQTILLGHLAGMRVAAPSELAEIAAVQIATEAVVISNQQARVDTLRLANVLSFERGEISELTLEEQSIHSLRHPQ
jgi:hypothetical protein